MSKSSRISLLVALGTALFHGAVTLLVFPAGLQFTKYPRAAAQHLAGVLAPERLLDFSPFYFHLHVLQRAFTNSHPVVWLQVGATAATAALLFLLLQRFFATWIALAGAAAFALNRSVTIYTPVLEPEPFLLLGLVGFLHFSLGDGRREWLLAGAFLALGVAIRPSVLPLLALAPLFFALQEGRTGRTGPKGWMRPSLLVLAPALAVLVALGLRNGVATGSFTPLGMNPGFVFYEGNNPISSGRSAVYPPVVGELKQEIPDHPDSPHLTYRLIAERSWDRGGTGLSTAEANRFWRQKALAFIADHPGRWASLLASKAYFAFHDYGRHDLVVAHRFGERLRGAWIPAIPFALVSALALGGLAASLPDWRRRLLVYGLFVSQLGMMLAVYVSDRQRLAIVPCFVFFACAALAWLSRLEPRRRLALGALVVPVAVALALPNDMIREDRHLWEAYRVADETRVAAFQAQREGRFEDAAALAAASFAAAPWLRDYSRPAGTGFGPDGFAGRALETLGPADADASSRFDRAQLLIEAGRFDEARGLLEALHAEGRRFDRGYAHSAEPLFYLSLIEAAEGRREAAIETLERALARTPGDPFALARLAALSGRDEPRRRLARYFGETDASFLVGIAQLEEEAGDGGVENLSRTVQRVPELWRAQVYLAAALAEGGNADAAVERFLAAMAERQEQVMLEDRFVPLFARAARDADDDPALARLRHGLVLAQYGRLHEALEVLHDATVEEARPEIERAIAQIEAMLGR